MDFRQKKWLLRYILPKKNSSDIIGICYAEMFGICKGGYHEKISNRKSDLFLYTKTLLSLFVYQIGEHPSFESARNQLLSLVEYKAKK